MTEKKVPSWVVYLGLVTTGGSVGGAGTYFANPTDSRLAVIETKLDGLIERLEKEHTGTAERLRDHELRLRKLEQAALRPTLRTGGG